ncbi:hypothetical protein [Stutzerimonas stutzeri]|uniref:Translation initiation factor 2 n=1 Tax=Stutzerimonas stutzeri TaxID=316 RepID=A0A6I6LQN9_STUST|nr:hypothetical protein [Stutzerimonas stutzeri]QGZ31633.1 hypothetical protein GQA94_16800 [Stutzerimonas stutzeri]
MRQGSLSLLLVLNIAMPLAHADEDAAALPAERQAELQQRLSENERQREQVADNSGISITAAERAQLARLRQENHRLRTQLQQSLPEARPQLLNDPQQWFAVGGGVGVLGFLLGVLTTRGRRRRQWLN